MMKLNKDSISNNTSEQPDKGTLPVGTDLYSLTAGRYFIEDISTMINIPAPEDLSGSALMLVTEFSNPGFIVYGMELWNQIGKYAFAGTIDGNGVAPWQIVNSGGGGSSEPVIGESIEWIGDESTIPYGGEWHNNKTTKVFDASTHSEIVALNPDSAEGANALNLISYYSGSNAYFAFPTGIKYWNDQDYYVLPISSIATSAFINYCCITGSEYDATLTRKYYGANKSGAYSIFWATPGVIEDDGNGQVLINDGQSFNSKFEIKGLKLYNGTTCDGFVTVSGSRSVDGPFCVNVKRTDLYLPDLSDWVNETTGERQSCEINNTSSSISNRSIGAVEFEEDGFWLLYNNFTFKKYSYDFTGGTLKEITQNPVYNQTINNISDKSNSTSFGNLTRSIYQIEMQTGNLFVDGVNVNTMIYTDLSSNIRYNAGYSSIVVHEYLDKVYVSVHFQNSSGNKAIQGWCYFDGVNWNNFLIPEPSTWVGTKSRSLMINKVDLSTGLIIASMQDENGSGDLLEPTDATVNFVISKDYGSTWFDDTGIINGSLDISINRMPIGLLECTHNMDLSSAIQNNIFHESSISAKMDIFKEGDPTFHTAESSRGYKIEFIYDAPLDTCTFQGYIPLSNKNKIFTRVK